MSSQNMSEFVGVFLDEAQEVLALLESDVLQLEHGTHSVDLLQSIFRAAHTLKGSSRTMGFLHIGNLTHEMENVLDELRQGKLEITTVIVNALLDCLDTLGALIESVASQGDDSNTGGRDVPALVSRLEAILGGGTASAPTVTESIDAASFEPKEHELAAILSVVDAGLVPYQVTITFDNDCMMKGLRLMMVLSALEPVATLVCSSVSEEEMEADTFGEPVFLVVAGESTPEAIQSAALSVSQIKGAAVSPWSAAPIVEAPIVVVEMAAVPVATPVPLKEEASKPAPATPQSAPASTTVRVDVSRLDSLLNLVGELVIDRTQLTRLAEELKLKDPRDSRVSELLETTNRLSRTVTELQDEIMKTRMLPVDGVFQRMPRMVRDLAQKTGKEVDFQVTGGSTEIDRSVLEVLADPLIHLLRNSVDHGLEPPADREAAGKASQGIVTLDARHERGEIVVEITDDGRGMDPEKLRQSAINKGLITPAAAGLMSDRDALNLIFAPGFSTAAALSDISGRGVGMDIVRSNLEKIGGRIDIDSTVGRGSRFSIHLPLTLAIVRALLVKADEATHVIAINSVVETLKLGENGFDASTVGGRSILNLRGRTVALANLALLLEGDTRATSPEYIANEAHVVVIGIGEKQVGLCVDSFAGEQEVVIKSLGALLGDLPGLAGAAIMGDGKVSLVVDAVRAAQSITEISAPQKVGVR